MLIHQSLLYTMQAGDGQLERSIMEDEIEMDTHLERYIQLLTLDRRKLLLYSSWKQTGLFGRSASLRTTHQLCA